MNIVNVYDFKGPHGYFFNGIDFDLLDEFKILNFKFNNDTINEVQKKVGAISNAYYNVLSEEIQLVSDIDEFEKKIYLYNLNTNGNLKLFLGLDKNSKKIKKSGFHFISKKALGYLREHKNFYITIYSGLEHELDKNDILELYSECLNLNIPRNKIIFFSNIIDSEKIINLFKNKFNIKSKNDFLFLNFNEQLLFKGDELANDLKKECFIQENEINEIKENKCLFLNRRLRPHRLIILSLLANDSLLENNLISFDFDYDDVSYFKQYVKDNHYIRVDEYFRASTFDSRLLDKEFVSKILNGFEILKSKNKMVLDVNNLNSIEGRHFEVDSKYLYENSYFSVVGETEFFDDWKDYTTEKIIKPIQQLHPFVLVGRPHSIRDLQKYGFKTFNKWWDESYDSIEDNNIRIVKVYEVIKNLINKSTSEWQSIYKEIKPILIHNQSLLKEYAGSKQKILAEKKLINILSNESIQKNTKLLQTP